MDYSIVLWYDIFNTLITYFTVMPNDIFAQKKEASKLLKKKYNFLQKYSPICMVQLKDQNILEKLKKAFKNLDIAFIIVDKEVSANTLDENIYSTSKFSDNDLLWIDCLICDDTIKGIDIYMKSWIVPIIERNTHLSWILQEFHANRNEWNTFFYDYNNEWSIFASLIRYLENYKFTFDNKNLVKNVLS